MKIITPRKPRPTPKRKPHSPLALKIMQFAFGTLGRIFPQWSANLAFHFFTSPQGRAKHKVSDEILEQANISDILIGKYMLKVYEWGAGDKTVMLVHGWESRGTALRSFVPQLVEAGYRVVAFDGPAHGDSSGKKADLKVFSGAIKAIYHKYENVKAIIAHSFGGAATAYAMYQLDASMTIEKFVMIGTPSRISYPVGRALDTMNAPTSVRKYFVEKLEKIVGIRLEDLTFKNIGQDLKIDKVLVVHDLQDEEVYFEQAENTVKYWNKAELQVTDGFGHFALMKNPEVIARVTTFVMD
ncbi:MAG: alpha/beta hydrolase [Bacteroidota bacterium]